MTRYQVTIWPDSPVTVTVEAPNEDDALTAAIADAAEALADFGANCEVIEASDDR